jgi:5-methylcytosine-specific restriction endonuclease McrA
MGLKELQAIRDNRDKPKTIKKYVIPKKSAKKIASEKTQKIEIVKTKKAGWFDVSKSELPDDCSNDLQQWFEDRHKEMTGTCQNCGGKTQKGQINYKSSIAHLLPKAYFPSIATNEFNWIELCFHGNSCHTNMDNKMLDLIDMNCFSEIVQKVAIMYPSIAPNERRRIPKILLEYIETEK